MGVFDWMLPHFSGLLTPFFVVGSALVAERTVQCYLYFCPSLHWKWHDLWTCAPSLHCTAHVRGRSIVLFAVPLALFSMTEWHRCVMSDTRLLGFFAFVRGPAHLTSGKFKFKTVEGLHLLLLQWRKSVPSGIGLAKVERTDCFLRIIVGCQLRVQE